jgi:hypothetical protein
VVSIKLFFFFFFINLNFILFIYLFNLNINRDSAPTVNVNEEFTDVFVYHMRQDYGKINSTFRKIDDFSSCRFTKI